MTDGQGAASLGLQVSGHAAGVFGTAIGTMGMLMTAAYILWTMQRVYLGTNPAYKDYPDMNIREILCAVPLVILAVAVDQPPTLQLFWMDDLAAPPRAVPPQREGRPP